MSVIDFMYNTVKLETQIKMISKLKTETKKVFKNRNTIETENNL